MGMAAWGLVWVIELQIDLVTRDHLAADQGDEFGFDGSDQFLLLVVAREHHLVELGSIREERKRGDFFFGDEVSGGAWLGSGCVRIRRDEDSRSGESEARQAGAGDGSAGRH